LVLWLLAGIATSAFAAGDSKRNPAKHREARPAPIRWSAEQRDVINSMRRLGSAPPFRSAAQQFEREVFQTEKGLKRARHLSQNPVEDRSAYDDVIRQLQHQRSKLMKLQKELATIEGKRETVGNERLQLQNELATIESEREAVRNERQMVTTQFEAANQKATQYVNMVSSVLRTMSEMRQGIIRNVR
jgi:chromosome segregation ATPase